MDATGSSISSQPEVPDPVWVQVTVTNSKLDYKVMSTKDEPEPVQSFSLTGSVGLAHITCSNSTLNPLTA